MLRKYYNILSICSFFLLISTSVYGQKINAINKKVLNAKEKKAKFFFIDNLLENPISEGMNVKSKQKKRQFNLNKKTCLQLISSAHENISIVIPADDKNNIMVLDLIKTPDIFHDYILRSGDGGGIDDKAIAQLHYRGIVQGYEKTSLVALSLYEEEIMGFISIKDNEVLNIGKIGNTNSHAITQILDSPTNECSTSGEIKNEEIRNIYKNLS